MVPVLSGKFHRNQPAGSPQNGEKDQGIAPTKITQYTLED